VMELGWYSSVATYGIGIRSAAAMTRSTPMGISSGRRERRGDNNETRSSTSIKSRSQVMMGKKSQEYDSKVEKNLADKLGDWSKGWPGGETALNGWVEMLELKPSVAREFAQSYDPVKLAELMAEQPGQVRARAFSIIKSLGLFAMNVLLDKQVHGAVETIIHQ
jgi:hypothetical protein